MNLDHAGWVLPGLFAVRCLWAGGVSAFPSAGACLADVVCLPADFVVVAPASGRRLPVEASRPSPLRRAAASLFVLRSAEALAASSANGSGSWLAFSTQVLADDAAGSGKNMRRRLSLKVPGFRFFSIQLVPVSSSNGLSFSPCSAKRLIQSRA